MSRAVGPGAIAERITGSDTCGPKRFPKKLHFPPRPPDCIPALAIGIMLSQRRSEQMSARPVGDKIKSIGSGRCENGCDRIAPGIGNRSGGQAGSDVGVVTV